MCEHEWLCAPYYAVNGASVQNPRICKNCGAEDSVVVENVQEILKQEGIILEKDKKFYEGGTLELFAKGGMKF